MKKQLNPELIRIKSSRDSSNVVFLRDAREGGQWVERAIGPTEIEVLKAETAVSEDFKDSLRAIDELARAEGVNIYFEPTNGSPDHIILTRDCFGCSDRLHLLIWSQKPFVT